MSTSRTILIAILLNLSICKIGDIRPFCYFPRYFPTTLQPSNKQLDLKKFSGKYYEQARLPVWFEKNCPCAEAVYNYQEEKNSIKITNFCIQNDGHKNEGHSRAYLINKQNTYWQNYMFKIFNGPQWILDFDDKEYNWVLFGEPCKKNAWIFSKDPEMNHDIKGQVIATAYGLGFDVSKFLHRTIMCR